MSPAASLFPQGILQMFKLTRKIALISPDQETGDDHLFQRKVTRALVNNELLLIYRNLNYKLIVTKGERSPPFLASTRDRCTFVVLG